MLWIILLFYKVIDVTRRECKCKHWYILIHANALLNLSDRLTAVIDTTTSKKPSSALMASWYAIFFIWNNFMCFTFLFFCAVIVSVYRFFKWKAELFDFWQFFSCWSKQILHKRKIKAQIQRHLQHLVVAINSVTCLLRT